MPPAMCIAARRSHLDMQNLHSGECGTAIRCPHTQHHPECTHSLHTVSPSSHLSRPQCKHATRFSRRRWYKGQQCEPSNACGSVALVWSQDVWEKNCLAGPRHTSILLALEKGFTKKLMHSRQVVVGSCVPHRVSDSPNCCNPMQSGRSERGRPAVLNLSLRSQQYYADRTRKRAGEEPF